MNEVSVLKELFPLNLWNGRKSLWNLLPLQSLFLRRNGAQREGGERGAASGSAGLWWSFPAVGEPSVAVWTDWWAHRFSHFNQTCQPQKLSLGLFTSHYRDEERPLLSPLSPKAEDFVSQPHTNQKHIDSSSRRPSNCSPFCQSHDASLLFLDQSCERRATCRPVTSINCCGCFTNESDLCEDVLTERCSRRRRPPTEANEITEMEMGRSIDFSPWITHRGPLMWNHLSHRSVKKYLIGPVRQRRLKVFLFFIYVFAANKVRCVWGGENNWGWILFLSRFFFYGFHGRILCMCRRNLGKTTSFFIYLKQTYSH